VHLENKEGEGVTLTFEVNGQLQHTTADLVVGADGIRSTVRRLVLGKTILLYDFRLYCDFRYLFIGIAQHLESPLLDSATVFQTANGNERIYIMPYDKDSVMWQLSFPMLEEEAKKLSALGPKYLKQEQSKNAMAQSHSRNS
jgi:2-polyprenyl-6-methoxyphenol hydroxylase-like FAD-dependent oxidoreductase